MFSFASVTRKSLTLFYTARKIYFYVISSLFEISEPFLRRIFFFVRAEMSAKGRRTSYPAGGPRFADSSPEGTSQVRNCLRATLDVSPWNGINNSVSFFGEMRAIFRKVVYCRFIATRANNFLPILSIPSFFSIRSGDFYLK